MFLFDSEKGIHKKKAFTALYEQQYERLFHFALYFVPEHDDCKDILADVFVTLWENWETLKKLDNPNSYIYTSVKNRCLKFLNRQNKFEEYIKESHVYLKFDESTPEDDLLTSEMKNIIEDALNQLPKRCKLIFLMLKDENLSYKEVATILNISEKTVQAQQIIAKKRLIQIIDDYLQFNGKSNS